MKPTDTTSPDNSLPIRNDLKLAYISSLVIALMMAGVSAAGILYQSGIYPQEELLETFVANDVVNIIVGLPILFVSMWLVWRGKLIGLLFWPGALFYVTYNYFVYVFAMPLSWVYLIFVTLFALSLYTLIALVANIDGEAVQDRLSGAVPVRVSGGVLVGLGALFLMRVLGVSTSALANQTPVPNTELALLVADFLMAPAWIMGGILLWRRQALGYVGGTGLLFQASMLFIGLIMFLLLQPLLTGAHFDLVDVIMVFMMGLICFIPFAFFVRGVARS